MHALQFPDYASQTRMAECLQFVRTIQLTTTFKLKIFELFEASKRGTVDAFCSNSSPLCCLSLTSVATVLSVAHSLSMAHPKDERKHTSASFSISQCGTRFRKGNHVQLVNLYSRSCSKKYVPLDSTGKTLGTLSLNGYLVTNA